jgi:hypothetical protein
LAGVIGDIANCFQAKRGIYMRKMPTLFILLVLSVAVLAWRGMSSSNEKAANTEIKGHTEISEDAVQSMVEGVRLRNGKQLPQNRYRRSKSWTFTATPPASRL